MIKTEVFVTTIKIISATPGPTTTEQILELIKSQSTGMTIKEISSQINRPVSMLQVYLKQLVSSKQIYTKKRQLDDSLYLPKFGSSSCIKGLQTIYLANKNL